METNSNIPAVIIETINTIFQSLFSSLDNNLYSILDDITFINSDIIKDSIFSKILGSSPSNGILLIANSLLLGFILYYSLRYLFSKLIYNQVESPFQFIFKCLIFGICCNFSYFFLEQNLDITSYISLAIRSIGEDLFGKNICFSELILSLNNLISFNTSSIDIFSLNGLIKTTLTASLLNLVFTYSLRYITLKIFILLTPFAFLSLILNSTSWFFRAWIKNIFSILFIQIIVSIVLLILFSINSSSNELITKFIYIGAINALIKSNTFVQEFIGGVSTTFTQNVENFFKK